MVDRLRALLEEPLDPRAGRAVFVLASAILLGVAALFVLADSEPDRPTSQDRPPSTNSVPAAPAKDGAGEPAGHRPLPRRRQDPQDVTGSAAAERAARALRSHRALQHVPYRDTGIRIALVGAQGSRAVLRVTASTVREARRGWHRFLRRYGDSGRAYVPVFDVSGGGNG